MTEILVVADDLTGAMDTGHAFAARGYETVVGFDATSPPSSQIAVVNTDSRYVTPDTARERVLTSITAAETDRVYKKVDSTLRGNLVAEVDGALDATGASMAVVAPAFPANGRTTACGTHLVDGRPVTETEAAADPDRPVRDAELQSLFSTSEHDVTHLDVDVVSRGPTTVREALPDHGLVTCDATHDAHLAAVAEGISTPSDTVLVGSGGFAAHVPVTGQPRAGSADDVTCSAVLGVVGSVAPETLDQLDTLPGELVVELDAATATVDPGGAADQVVTACESRIREHSRAVVTAATDAGDVDVALRSAEQNGVTESTARRRIADALARTTRRLWKREQTTPDGLVLTGGAIAGAVLSKLGAHGVELTGRAVVAGVPEGIVRGGLAEATPVITKAGGFGDRRAILKTLTGLSVDNGER